MGSWNPGQLGDLDRLRLIGTLATKRIQWFKSKKSDPKVGLYCRVFLTAAGRDVAYITNAITVGLVRVGYQRTIINVIDKAIAVVIIIGSHSG
jgi:hypothetical protein